MKIHVPTKLVCRTETEEYLCYRRVSGGKAEPYDSVDWPAYDLHPFEDSAYTPATQVVTDELVESGGVYRFAVRDKTAEELAAELEFNIDRLDASVRAHLDRHAHWTAGNMVGKKAQEGKGKAVAVYVWAETVWGLYYATVDALRAGTVQWSEDLLAQWPACPHTMREVRDE